MSDTYLPLPPPIAESDLSDIVEGILRVGRCLSVEEIVDRAYDDGWDLDDDPHSDVLNELDDPDRPYFPLADGRWVHLPSLLSGQVLTHRVTAEEIEHDVLAVVPDLSLFHLLTEFPGFEQLAGGGDVGFAYDNSPIEDAGREIPAGVLAELGSLVLASGTLKPRGLVSGDLVGLRCGTDGIEVVDIDAAGVPAAMLRDHLLGMLDPDRPSEVDDVIAGLLAAVPDGFVQPLPPISQLLDSWGVWQHDDLLAAPGFDFDSWLATRKAEWQEERYGLTTQESAAVRTILALLRVGSDLISAAGTGDADDGLASPPSEVLIERADLPVGVLEAVTGELAEPAVAYAVLDQWQVEMSWAGTLAAVCPSLEALTPRRGRVGLHWLWAKALEDLDDTRSAASHLRTAERLDPDWPPVVVDLARYAGDRGDAAAGLALLDRLDEEAAPFLREILERYRPQPSRTMPRNAPCWCGSGRKFKQCHQRQGHIRPLTERAYWLYLKAAAYATETDWRSLVSILTEIRSADATSPQEAEEMSGEGLVLDVALFEGGVLAEYVRRQGWLLPTDELLLAQQWLLVERSVYEVVDSEPGVNLTLRDLRTGDSAIVGVRSASQHLRPGHLICTHLLPLPDEGFLELTCLDPVQLQERDPLMAMLDDVADPERLVAYLSRRFAPPTLLTPEGDSIVLSQLELSSSDPTALAAALDDTYPRSPDDETEDDPEVSGRWSKLVETDTGMDSVKAALVLRGAALTVHTASRERLAQVRAELFDLQPDLTVTDEDYRVVDDTLVKRARSASASAPAPAGRHETSTTSPTGPFGQPLDQSPEVREAVTEHIRGYEDRWLDLEIPALAGLTPRQAAADPTRRDDLIRLLATFPEATDPTEMDPDRLRSLLGLG